MKISKFEILTNFQEKLKYKRANKNLKSFSNLRTSVQIKIGNLSINLKKKNVKTKISKFEIISSHKFKKNIKFKRTNKNSKSFSNLTNEHTNKNSKTFDKFKKKSVGTKISKFKV